MNNNKNWTVWRVRSFIGLKLFTEISPCPVAWDVAMRMLVSTSAPKILLFLKQISYAFLINRFLMNMHSISFKQISHKKGFLEKVIFCSQHLPNEQLKYEMNGKFKKTLQYSSWLSLCDVKRRDFDEQDKVKFSQMNCIMKMSIPEIEDKWQYASLLLNKRAPSNEAVKYILTKDGRLYTIVYTYNVMRAEC